MKFAAPFALIVLLAIATLPAAAKKTKSRKATSSAPGLAQLKKMTARYAPTSLRVDTSKLSTGDRQALVKLIEAGRIMNDIFLVQYWSGNPALYARLQKDSTPWARHGCSISGSTRVPGRRWIILRPFCPAFPRRSPREQTSIPRT